MSKLIPLSTFGFEVAPVPSKAVGKRGELKMIPVSKLRIDPSYQRQIEQLGRRNIRRIIEKFQWHKFSPVVVAKRPGGVFAIMDGQHRAVACALHGGIKEIPCLIQNCTTEQEAEAFAAINGSVTRMHTQHLFRARIAAGDKAAIAADNAAKDAGAIILAYPVAASLLKAGETLAGKTIEVEMERVGRDVVVAAIELITRTGDGNPGMVKASVIEGFCEALGTHPKWMAHTKQIRQVVQKKTIPAIFTEAMQRRGVLGGTEKLHIGSILAEALKKELGDGGYTPIVTGKQKAREKAKRDAKEKSAAHKAEEHRRVLEAHRLSQSRAAAPQAKKGNERELIEAHLKSKGARKFESGATADTSILMDWLTRVCGRKTQRLSLSGAKAGKIYKVDGRKYDLVGLLGVVNQERKSRKLQPIMLEAA